MIDDDKSKNESKDEIQYFVFKANVPLNDGELMKEWITKLSKSEYLFLKKMIINENTRYILDIVGNLEYNGITLRKTKRVYTEEEKKGLSERAKRNLKGRPKSPLNARE